MIPDILFTHLYAERDLLRDALTVACGGNTAVVDAIREHVWGPDE